MPVLRPLSDDEFDAALVADAQYWDEGDVAEIIAVVALFGFLNRWNDSMGTSLEDLPMASADRNLSHVGWNAGKHG